MEAFERSSGDAKWMYCSADLAWRTVIDADKSVVILHTLFEDQTGSGSAVQHAALVGLDAELGSELWRFPLVAEPTGLWSQGPLSAGGVVVVEMADGERSVLVGLDSRTGSERWRSPAEVTEATLMTPDGRVATQPGGSPVIVMVPQHRIANTADTVVVEGSGGLRGLDRATGEQRWRSTVAAQIEAVVGDTIIVQAIATWAGSATLIGLDGRTGTVQWESQAQLVGLRAGADVVAGVSGGEVGVLDPANGETLWTQPGRASYGGPLAVGADILVVLDQSDDVLGYDLKTGELRWRRTRDQSEGGPLGEPLEARGDRAYLLGEGRLSELATSDGSTRWVVSTPTGSLESSLRTAADRVFVSFNTMPWRD